MAYNLNKNENMTHALKTWPAYYTLVENGTKNFEIREMDRPFKVGDTVILQEWNPETKQYTGKECTYKIGFIFEGPGFGLKSGYCVMSLTDVLTYM